MKPLGIIVGLQAEARLARPWNIPIAVGGGDAAGAARAATALAGQVSGLISFGLAGGLAPSLSPGALLVPSTVTDHDGRWAADPELMALLGGNTGHILLGGGAIVATVAQKTAAHRAGADAVDLESAAVARVAAAANLPFAVLRAICDDAGSTLPPAATHALDAQGQIQIGRVLAALLRRPRDIVPLIALARNAARARTALLGRVRATSLIRESA